MAPKKYVVFLFVCILPKNGVSEDTKQLQFYVRIKDDLRNAIEFVYNKCLFWKFTLHFTRDTPNKLKLDILRGLSIVIWNALNKKKSIVSNFNQLMYKKV